MITRKNMLPKGMKAMDEDVFVNALMIKGGILRKPNGEN